MSETITEIRRGAYYDSVVLMQLQASLNSLPGIENVGVMMGTAINKDILKQNGLLTSEAESAQADDLIISVKGLDEAAVKSALRQIDGLLSKRSGSLDQDYLPKSLGAAAKMLPDANWVLVSVPGQYAADVAFQALSMHKHVFLYSDNVSVKDELSLKKEAASKGLLIMGPDCGTAIINGVGLGFANQIRQGPIGLVGASGTGLQQVSASIHQLGSGITHAIGTGGRDLSEGIGGITAFQALNLLNRDPQTKIIVLISKPPSQKIAAKLLQTALKINKPVVINFIGHIIPPDARMGNNIHFATSLQETAKLATKLVNSKIDSDSTKQIQLAEFTSQKCYVRGLFSGGTLAYEALLILQNYLPIIYSNIPLKKEFKLPESKSSKEHTIIDLGEDEFTVGRPHPMIDNTLRLERLSQEANDPEVAMILLDVVLGHGSHPDPAGELSPAIAKARANAKNAGRELEFVIVLVGTDEDSQDINSQMKQLKDAGAHVETNISSAAKYVGERLQGLSHPEIYPEVDLTVLEQPMKAINVGLMSFTESLQHQDATVMQVDWRPPAGGNEDLMAILQRMKNK